MRLRLPLMQVVHVLARTLILYRLLEIRNNTGVLWRCKDRVLRLQGAWTARFPATAAFYLEVLHSLLLACAHRR